MPHLMIEYSGNLKTHINIHAVILQANQVLIQSSLFLENDIKTRAICFDDFLIGSNKLSNQAFIHLKLAILKGRTIDVKNKLSNSLLQIQSQSHLATIPLDIQLCVEILEICDKSYSKAYSKAILNTVRSLSL